jgi:hypothetical protein
MKTTTNYQLPYIGPDDLVSDAPTGFEAMFQGVDDILKTFSDRLGELTLNTMYPIGSIYMSTTDTNPGLTFGGTWERWGTGKVPVGVDESDEDFAHVEATGGEKTHTLTVDELASHTHLTPRLGIANGGYHVSGTASTGQVGIKDGLTTPTGGNKAHNNLQPYVTCYMWKRTK